MPNVDATGYRTIYFQTDDRLVIRLLPISEGRRLLCPVLVQRAFSIFVVTDDTQEMRFAGFDMYRLRSVLRSTRFTQRFLRGSDDIPLSELLEELALQHGASNPETENAVLHDSFQRAMTLVKDITIPFSVWSKACI